MSNEQEHFTQVPEWITLADLTPQADKLYTVLLAHVNRKRGDDLAWPSMTTLAKLLKFDCRQSVSIYVRELVDLGAIEVEARKTPKGRRNFYTVHLDPPDGYTGLRSITDFYQVEDDGAGRSGESPAQGGWSSTDDDPWQQGSGDSPQGSADVCANTVQTDEFAAQEGSSSVGDHGGSSSVGDDGSSSVGDQNHMNKNQKNSKDTRTAANSPDSQAPRGLDDQSVGRDVEISIPHGFDEMAPGHVAQYLVGAAAAASLKFGVVLSGDQKREMGQHLKDRLVAWQQDRHDLAAEVRAALIDRKAQEDAKSGRARHLHAVTEAS